MDIFSDIMSPTQVLTDEVICRARVLLSIKREDLNHPDVMGNKLRKLKYNIIKARQLNSPALLSFGGAYSNHILALSAAGKLYNFATLGVIRGEELSGKPLNPVLSQARKNGMRLQFISREQYKIKHTRGFIQQLQADLGDFYYIPEGGSNALGVQGAAEILDNLDTHYDFIVCACGTGGTLAGLIKGAQVYQPNARVIGVSVLKNNSCHPDDIIQMAGETACSRVAWELNTDYHFGGYAQTSPVLLTFMREFKASQGIDLDYIYTGKMMYAVYQLIRFGYFPKGSKILAIHTGGTQTAAY